MRSSVVVAAGLVALICAGVAPGAPTRTLGRFPARNVQFFAQLDEHDEYSDIWGYTAPDGREYALVGEYRGLSVINITNRARPRETGFIPGAPSFWRDVKTYGSHAYVVNENGGGIAIVDLSDPEHPVLARNATAIQSAHNLFIDEEAGLLFTAGADVPPGIGGTRIFSLADPLFPSQVAAWNNAYVHDVYARDGVMYLSALYEGALHIVDVSNLPALSSLGSVSGYPDAFTHNAWPTADGGHVMTTDEVPAARVKMWDIGDPSQPALVGSYSADAPGARFAIPHNVLIEGDLAYVSYYTTGVRVVDISDRSNPVEVAYFDSYQYSDAAAFLGCWGVFPYFPNSPDLFIASDIQHGLFVLLLDSHGVAAGRPARDGSARDAVPGAVPARLGPAFPNPVRPGSGTRVEIVGVRSGPIVARVFDAAGRLVRALEPRRAGRGARTLRWDARDGQGRLVSSGTYFLRVRAADTEMSRRLTVLH